MILKVFEHRTGLRVRILRLLWKVNISHSRRDNPDNLGISSIINGVDDGDGNNASYVAMSAAQTYSNPLRSPPDHADNIGHWTDEELSLYNDDNYTGDPPGEFFHCRLPEEVELAYFDIIRPVVLRYCNEHFLTFASGLLPYGLVRTHIHNA